MKTDVEPIIASQRFCRAVMPIAQENVSNEELVKLGV
jgi:hypothetical protein